MNTHEARIDSTLNALRADQNALRTDIEREKNTQIKWIIGVGLGLAALILGVAAYLG